MKAVGISIIVSISNQYTERRTRFMMEIRK